MVPTSHQCQMFDDDLFILYKLHRFRENRDSQGRPISYVPRHFILQGVVRPTSHNLCPSKPQGWAVEFSAAVDVIPRVAAVDKVLEPSAAYLTENKPQKG